MSDDAPLLVNHLPPTQMPEDVEQSSLYSEDLAPTPPEGRTWTTYNYAALWIGMAHCLPTYMMAAGLMRTGLNWWQALLTILIGNLIVLVPMLLNSHGGTKYGLPFPVLCRASFGVFGANVPAILRALVACGWFGIQTWLGGAALDKLLVSQFPSWGHVGYHDMACFLLFWALNVALIWKGMDAVRWFEGWAAPAVLVVTMVLLSPNEVLVLLCARPPRPPVVLVSALTKDGTCGRGVTVVVTAPIPDTFDLTTAGSVVLSRTMRSIGIGTFETS